MLIRNYFFLFLLQFIQINLFAQKATISGFVRESKSNEVIVGAKIFSLNERQGGYSNGSGYFSLTLPVSDYELIIDAFGYQRQKIKLSIQSDTIINFYLALDKLQYIEEVTVKATMNQSIDDQNIGEINVPLEQLKNIPNLTGEPDVIKAYQLMPGVQGGAEGTSGLFVRGGTPDQNLFLLDDLPLYYVSHIGGFVSTFDPNAINDIKLYKGGFPARYGGRLSSVVDITMKDGNQDKIKGEVAVGLLTTKLQLDGPFSKDSSWTYFLSGRRFNLDLFTRLYALIDSQGESSAGYTFYDLNGKLVKRFKNGGKLGLTLYEGRDRVFLNAKKKSKSLNDVSYKYKSNVKWGNFMLNLFYSKPLGSKLFGDFSLGTTNFKYFNDVNSRYSNKGETELVNQSRIKFVSKINDIIAKAKLQYSVNPSYNFLTGITSTLHFFTPGDIQYSKKEDDESFVEGNKVLAFENNIFIENNIKIGKKFTVNAGVNYTTFVLSDTTFHSLQPRVSASWEIFKGFSLQCGYSRMTQNLHYLTNSGIGLPSDIWIPVSKKMKPENSNQYNVGFTYTLKNRKFPLNFIIEGYYKDLSNLIDFKGGSNIFQTTGIEEKIAIGGVGEIYGLEVLIQKKVGKLTGWISYTLSKNTRKFDEVNNGIPYPFRFDRTHDFSITLSYEINQKIQITGAWVYNTGTAITLAQAKYNLVDIDYEYENSSVHDQFYHFDEAHLYNGKNSVRLPSYHRLDVGVKLIKKKKKGVRTWYFGVYNLYNRQNPFLLFYKKNNENQVKLHQLTIFPIIPSFSYSFVF